MMAFDKDKDGKLTKAEVTDERLHRLFDRADADKDGVVTKDELTALAAREAATTAAAPRRRPRAAARRAHDGAARPGEVLPPMLQRRLKLTAEQKAQLAALQKDVDGSWKRSSTTTRRRSSRRCGSAAPADSALPAAAVVPAPAVMALPHGAIRPVSTRPVRSWFSWAASVPPIVCYPRWWLQRNESI